MSNSSLSVDAEDETEAVDGVQSVNDDVKHRHDRHHHQFILVRNQLAVTLSDAEAVQRPYHHGRHVHHCRQDVIDNRYLVKGERDEGGELCQAQDHQDDGKDEA